MTNLSSQRALEKQIEKLDQEIAETRELLKEPSYAALAQVEIARLEEEKGALETSLEALENHANPSPSSAPAETSKSTDPSQVILEIRPAAGGDEAGLFASQLLRMYQKFAQNKGWKVQELSKTEGKLGNLKEASLQISASNVHQLLKNEAGVHRVQRVPSTEKSGRIHTSTVTVAILPVVSEVVVNLNPDDLKIETYRSSGPGGQHMQKTESAVRITHLPTGITATSQAARHQLANREQALMILRSRLYDEMRSQQKESLAEVRAEAVGQGQRAEKIRTYNFPQNRVTDHRLKRSWHNLEAILNGNLEEISEELLSAQKGRG